MHEFEFEIRISDQIQVGRQKFEILFGYYESALGNNTPYGEKKKIIIIIIIIMEHECEV
jgi:hypothetical protein